MVKKIGRTALRSCFFHQGAEAAGRHDGQPNAARWQRLDALWKEKHRGRHSSNKSEMLSPLSDGNASGSLDGSRFGERREGIPIDEGRPVAGIIAGGGRPMEVAW